jgi:hypothetical protein
MEGKGPRKEQLPIGHYPVPPLSSCGQCPVQYLGMWRKGECHTTIAMFADFDDWVPRHFD